ncbi:MAG: CCA tRNA nucleotidyltransferase [Candidatus Pacebacteria bacterium]|nr:CCA tRNA nucleotidyltransferase [Candidatus Paceibacterota bacterium]
MSFPEPVKKILEKIKAHGFQGYLVGGCVRDILRGVEPSDFDIATNAFPEDLQKIFPKSFSNNNFGTVTVLTGAEEENLKEVEITTYRTESGYNDKRHPDSVDFVDNLEEDLKRRDFTINAMAIGADSEVVDLFNGKEDLKNKIIRAVGDPEERFSEDALRLMRAVRFSSSLGFSIEEETKKALKKNASLLKNISNERIRDEFVKIIMTPRAVDGVENLRKLGLMKQFLPEVLEGYKVPQNKHHIYDCYTHCLYSFKYAVKKNFGFHVRLASLFHDIGKPRTKDGEGEQATFYNHEVVGARMTKNILKRLRFKKEDVEKIYLLVRYHLFYYNVGEVSESSVRRLLKKVGKENIEELLQVRMADRIGSGVPKAEPYRLRHMRYLIEKVSLDPINTGMLEIDGKEVMEKMDLPPGPLIGDVLNIILLEVINDPQKNKKSTLEEYIEDLKKIKKEDLREKAERARKEIEKIEIKRDEMTKKKYWVS